MKKSLKFSLHFIILLIVCAVFVTALVYFYDNNQFFHSLFNTSDAAVLGEAADGQTTLAGRAEFAGRLSIYIYAIILAMQLGAFYIGCTVLSNIRNSAECVTLKLKKLENADIFLDLPLYIGLFGTVSSFVVISYSPMSGRLIAYSSTLIGIIFSVVMRVLLQYPLRSRLLDDKANEK